LFRRVLILGSYIDLDVLNEYVFLLHISVFEKETYNLFFAAGPHLLHHGDGGLDSEVEVSFIADGGFCSVIFILYVKAGSRKKSTKVVANLES
jgi:hypothetical protein